MSCYIYQLPSWVLDDLCRNMDTLSEWDWMQFGEWSFLRPPLSPLPRVSTVALCCPPGPGLLRILRRVLPLFRW